MTRRIKRNGKKERLIEKLGKDKYKWAWEIQTEPFPSWSEAFDYAYELGLKKGKND